MTIINESEILDEMTVCPYCMCQVSYNKITCCGESRSHFETAYVLDNGETLLGSEVKIVKGA